MRDEQLQPVVVLGSTRWAQRVALGDWQLARAFSALGHDVVWMDPPSSVFARRPASPQPEQEAAHPAVEVVRPGVLTGSRRWVLEGVQDLMYERQVQGVLRTDGPEPLLLVATPAHGGLRRVAGAFQLVYWQKDRQWAQPKLPNRDWLRRRHEELLLRADVVTAVSPEIVEDNRTLGVHSTMIPNGVDVAHWSGPRPQPVELAAIPRPRALFLGAWSWRVDTELVDQVARRLPHVHIVIVGKVSAPTQPRANVHFLGPKPYDSLPGYAQHCDVGLVPYVRATFNASSNPLKIFEYSAAGLPVVTQSVSTAEGFAHVRVSQSADEWEQALVDTTAASQVDRSAIISSMSGHDWKDRAAELRRRAAP